MEMCVSVSTYYIQFQANVQVLKPNTLVYLRNSASVHCAC